MLDFLSANWLWILLIGGMLYMHLGHGGHGGHGGCGGHGGHAHSNDQHDTSTEQPADRPHDPAR